MENTVFNDTVSCDFKKRPPIPSPHPVLGNVIAETLNIATKVVFKPYKPFNHARSIRSAHAFRSFSAFGLSSIWNFKLKEALPDLYRTAMAFEISCAGRRVTRLVPQLFAIQGGEFIP